MGREGHSWRAHIVQISKYENFHNLRSTLTNYSENGLIDEEGGVQMVAGLYRWQAAAAAVARQPESSHLLLTATREPSS